MTWTQADVDAANVRAMTECGTCEHVRCRHVGCAEHDECCDEDGCQCVEFVEPTNEGGMGGG
jgi:hypothetical protein